MRKFSPVCLSFLCSLSLLDGCGGTLGGNPEVAGSNPSSGKALSFAITDAPVEDAKNVFITVESVSLLQENGAWQNIPMETSTEIDLLHYRDGLTSPLAAISDLAPGTYTQTRLILSESQPARLVDLSGVEHILKIPSGSESGLKIKTPIVIQAGVARTMIIDFDLRKSIKITGNGNNPNAKYMMKPVLRMIELKESGSLGGSATDGDVICLFPTAAAKDSTDDCDNASATGTAKASKISLNFITPGTYDLRVFRKSKVLRDVPAIKIEANTLTEFEGI